MTDQELKEIHARLSSIRHKSDVQRFGTKEHMLYIIRKLLETAERKEFEKSELLDEVEHWKTRAQAALKIFEDVLEDSRSSNEQLIYDHSAEIDKELKKLEDETKATLLEFKKTLGID